jgi:hypothetical protein
VWLAERGRSEPVSFPYTSWDRIEQRDTQANSSCLLSTDNPINIVFFSLSSYWAGAYR